MRVVKFIYLFIYLFSFNAYSTNNNDKLSKYNVLQYEITEYNCNCTMQTNKFVIINKMNYVRFEIDNISEVLMRGDNATGEHRYDSSVAFFIKNRKLCDVDVNLLSGYLYLLSRVPQENSYCYSIDGYINNDKLHSSYSDLKYKKYKKIKVLKQFLYTTERKKLRSYLILGDEVRILQEQSSGWVKIRYSGKTDITAWIPSSSLTM